jgi:hypothetical protein
VAWYYERSGIFTVKIAYRLAVEEKRRREGLDASSSGATDGRSMYKDLWSVDVPPKVRIFAWKLATDGLATQDKRSKRGMVLAGVCQVCWNGFETGHHAVIGCTKAAVLCEEMRKVWLLPDGQQLQDSGPGWQLLLLSNADHVEGVVPTERCHFWDW